MASSDRTYSRQIEGYVYEARRRRADSRWEARRTLPTPTEWQDARSLAFAVIRAGGGDTAEPEKFGATCREWESEVSAGVE